MRFTLIASVFLLFATSAFCQNEMPTKDGKVFYEMIDSSVRDNAQNIHLKARLWVANTFKDSKSVVQIDDLENKLLIGKGNFQFDNELTHYIIYFTIKIDSKDNRYRVQIYDMIIQKGTYDERKRSAEHYNERAGMAKVKKQVNWHVRDIFYSIESAVAKKDDKDF